MTTTDKKRREAGDFVPLDEAAQMLRAPVMIYARGYSDDGVAQRVAEVWCELVAELREEIEDDGDAPGRAMTGSEFALAVLARMNLEVTLEDAMKKLEAEHQPLVVSTAGLDEATRRVVQEALWMRSGLTVLVSSTAHAAARPAGPAPCPYDHELQVDSSALLDEELLRAALRGPVLDAYEADFWG